jgi:hypothetical protein
LYGEEEMLPEEIMHQSLHVIKQAMAEDEEYSKKIIEGTRLKLLRTSQSTKSKPKNGKTYKKETWSFEEEQMQQI